MPKLTLGRVLPVAALLAALLVLALTVPVGPEPEPEAPAEPDPSAADAASAMPPAMGPLTERGLQVVERFQAPGGLTGFTARAGGREVVIYTTPDGRHALVGTMLDAEGKNLSEEHLAKHMPAPDRQADWQRLEDAHWVATGAENPERVVYMFTDPFCPYCNAIWRASRPYYDEGLQIRHVLVGIIKAQSMDRAAAILAADDPAAAFRAHQEAYDGAGSPDNLGEPGKRSRSRVQINNQLMRDLGLGGTPAVFYRTAEGEVRVANGMPKLSKLAEMYRLPEQTVDDPSLDRYR
jgi:thiol:disulfide interchange protein DsbG